MSSPKAPSQANPRRHPRHKERGGGILLRVRWADLARAFGRSVHTVKKWGTGRGRKFNPRDVADVIRFASERKIP